MVPRNMYLVRTAPYRTYHASREREGTLDKPKETQQEISREGRSPCVSEVSVSAAPPLALNSFFAACWGVGVVSEKNRGADGENAL